MSENESMSSTGANRRPTGTHQDADPVTAIKVKMHTIAVVAGALSAAGGLMLYVTQADSDQLPVWNLGLAALVLAGIMTALAAGLAVSLVNLKQTLRTERHVMRELAALGARQEQNEQAVRQLASSIGDLMQDRLGQRRGSN